MENTTVTTGYSNLTLKRAVFDLFKVDLYKIVDDLDGVPEEYAYTLLHDEMHPYFLIENIVMPQWRNLLKAAGKEFPNFEQTDRSKLLPLYPREIPKIAVRGNSGKLLLSYAQDMERVTNTKHPDMSMSALLRNKLMEEYVELRYDFMLAVDKENKKLINSALPKTFSLKDPKYRMTTYWAIESAIIQMFDSLFQAYLFPANIYDNEVEYMLKKFAVHSRVFKAFDRILKKNPEILN